MTKKLIATFVGSLLLLAAGAGSRARAHAADDKMPAKPAAAAAAQPAGKEVTLKGSFGCYKCSFKEGKKCENVLKVKEAGSDVTYHLADNAVSQKNHETVCHSPGKPATVKGTVSEAAGKKTVTASDIKFD